jgi:GntR family negative regulator for fad regulon and positive regulator of fabA
MPDLPRWAAPDKPAELTYTRIISAILDGTFPANTPLPGERLLADRLGVTRSTLREAMQRLAADGWLDIQHGRRTRVRDIWTEGNLNVLASLVAHRAVLPATFIPQLLEVRAALAPVYTRTAVARNAEGVAQLIDGLERSLNDTPGSFAAADWSLHHGLTVLSANPVYTLMLNGFAGFYQDMARLYFNTAAARENSRRFYADLHAAALAGDADAARQIAETVMQHSIDLWRAAAADGGAWEE